MKAQTITTVEATVSEVIQREGVESRIRDSGCVHGDGDVIPREGVESRAHALDLLLPRQRSREKGLKASDGSRAPNHIPNFRSDPERGS